MFSIKAINTEHKFTKVIDEGVKKYVFNCQGTLIQVGDFEIIVALGPQCYYTNTEDIINSGIITPENMKVEDFIGASIEEITVGEDWSWNSLNSGNSKASNSPEVCGSNKNLTENGSATLHVKTNKGLLKLYVVCWNTDKYHYNFFMSWPSKKFKETDSYRGREFSGTL